MEIAIYFSEKLVLFLLLLYNYVKFKTVKKTMMQKNDYRIWLIFIFLKSVL